MSSRFHLTPSSYPRFIQEGRGTGHGATYIPWNFVQERPSNCRAFRYPSIKNQRIIHILGEDELAYALYLERTPAVWEYQEQVPCLPIEKTLWLHSHYPQIRHHPLQDGIPAVVVSSFSFSDHLGLHYCSLVQSDGTIQKKNLSKLHLEYLYYALNENGSADFTLIQPPLFTWTLLQNMQILSTYAAALSPLHADLLTETPSQEMISLYEDLDRPVTSICADVERHFSLPAGTGVSLFSQLVLTGQICFDFYSRFFPMHPRLDPMGHSFPYDQQLYERQLRSGRLIPQSVKPPWSNE